MNAIKETPLPLIVTGESFRSKGTEHRIQVWSDAGERYNVFTMDFAAVNPVRNREIAEEMVKARNAYPKLVDGLRKVLELAAVQRGMLKFDKTPTETDAAALLRELGEEA